MISLLKRKSIIAFIAICFIGAFLPMLLDGHPADTVGAPFARPIFWNSNLPALVEMDISTKETSFEWRKNPPAIFSLSGTVKANPTSEVKIVWHTPNKDFVLATLIGQPL